MWMKAHFHQKFVCMWSSCEKIFNMRTFNLMDSLLMNQNTVNCVTQHVTCDLFSNSFNLHLQLPNSMQVGVEGMIFETDPSKTFTGIIWWPHTSKMLWKSTEQDMATKHIMQDIQDSIHCMGACTILLEKCCVHMPCYWNDLILQLLQVPLVHYDALHKDWFISPCLLIAHLSAFCRMYWHLNNSAWIIRGPVSCVLFVHDPLRWKWASSLNHKPSKVAGYCCLNCKKSWQNSHLCCMLLAVTICTWFL